MWAYSLKNNKDPALTYFKLFQALVERETSKKLKCVHLDNGSEYRGPFEELQNSWNQSSLRR